MALTIFIFTFLCLANMILHVKDVKDDPENEGMGGGEAFRETMKSYWISLVGSFIAVVFSIFVFGLCGFHTYLVHIGLTTQEKLKHIYDKYPISPFRHASCFPNWSKVVFWPQSMETRVHHLMIL